MITYEEAVKIPRPKNPIPFFVPSLGEEEEEEVVATLRSGWLTSGARVQRFEEELRKFLGTEREICAVSSCTAALFLSLVAAGVKPGDSVLVPTFTFASTVNVILHLGAHPVFCDIHPETLNIDVDQIPSKIHPGIKVLLPVHFGGYPADLKRIYSLARAHHLIVVEDAAHALGASWNGRKIGSEGDFICFSFYANKNLTTGEGGAISLPPGEWTYMVKILRNHGMSASAWERHSSLEEGYDILFPGYKFNMPDILAAIGTQQLRKFSTFQEKRKKIARMYRSCFSRFPGIKLPGWEEEGRECSYHLFPVILSKVKNPGDRALFLRLLAEEGVHASVHYRPVHLFSYYQKRFGYREGDFPVAEDVFRRILSLPIYPSMSEEMVYQTIGAVARALQRFLP